MTHEMIERLIGSTGEPLPVIGLGTWQTFDVGRSSNVRTTLESCVADLAAAGGRVIDSSPMYGRAEQVVGDIVTTLELRDRLFIATKVWTTGKQRGIDQMTESMRKLNVAQVDLLQVHNLVDVRTHLETLREWKAAGRIRYIGVTHYTASAHAEVAKVLEREPVDFVQINYSVSEREAEQRILPLAADRGIGVIVNRPFGGGKTLGAAARRPVPPWAPEIGCGSWAQLLLKFVISHPAVTCAIPATSNLAHLRDNLGAGTGPMPDQAIRVRIAEAVG
jgi:diketogulonate reductase-like aldo/keto reductase